MAKRENIRLIYEVLTQQLDRQFDHIRRVDTKAYIVLGCSLGLALLSLELYVLIAATASSLLAIFALHTRSWQLPPKPRAFLVEMVDETEEKTMLQQCSNIVAAYEANEKRLRAKTLALVLSTASLTAAVAINLAAKLLRSLT